MLVSWLIFTRLFKPDQIKKFKAERKEIQEDYRHKTIENILWYCIILIFLLLNVVPAMLIASNCDGNNVVKLVLAFVFSDIYVFNYTIRKFIFKDGYCNV
jgi:hypothetical protein